MEKKKVLIDIDFVLRDWTTALVNSYIKKIQDWEGKIENLDTIWEYFTFPQYIELQKETNDFEVYESVMAIDEKAEWVSNRDYFNKFVLEFILEIFGYADESVKNAVVHVNRLQQESPDFEITLFAISKGKAIPPTYFFLSKSGCEIQNVKFFKSWKDIPCDEYGHIITANTDIAESYRDRLTEHTKVLLVDSEFNQNFDWTNRVSNIKWIGALTQL